MNSLKRDLPAGLQRQPKGDAAALVAAYREGLGLTAIALIRGSGAMRIAAGEDADGAGLLASGEAIEALWWCRRADDAARLAAAVMSRLRRQKSGDEESGASRSRASVVALVESAAERRCIALYSDDEISSDAQRIIARMNEEVAALQRTGQLKSVNQSYRTYRIESAARGERALPYARWLDQYKANLVRELAAALRFT